MDLTKKKKELFEYFLEFGAENGLDEAHVEKMERVLHTLKPKSMASVKKICKDIVKHGLIDLPEDEIIDYLKESKIVK